MPSEIDLFNLEDPDSLPRRLIGNESEVCLESMVPIKYSIPFDYRKKELRIKRGESEEVISLISSEIKRIRKHGYPENINTPIYEAILNAYQHGNKRDPKKGVTFAYRIGPRSLDVLVEDEGGVIDAIFIPFILKHREADVKKHFINFYEFSGREKPQTNNGTGTSFMHAYMDGVRYYLGEKGLVVHMVKTKH